MVVCGGELVGESNMLVVNGNIPRVRSVALRGHVRGLTFAMLLCSLATGIGLANEASVLPHERWPGPLVELTLKGDGLLLGYMTAFEKGNLRLRLLDGRSSQTISSREIESMKLLQPKPPVARDTEIPKKKKRKKEPPPHGVAGLKHEDSKARPDTPESERPESRDRWKPGERWDRLRNRWAERDRDGTPRKEIGHVVRRIRELSGKTDRTEEEDRELQNLKRKIGHRDALTKYHKMARQAREEGRLKDFMNRHREALGQAKTIEDIRRYAAGLLFGHVVEGKSTEESTSAVERDINTHVRPEVREQFGQDLKRLKMFLSMIARARPQDRPFRGGVKKRHDRGF